MKQLVYIFALLLSASLSLSVHAQQQDDNVVRIKTELVQTDVNVVDKQGKFVDNVRLEDLELTLDGKPQKVLFFERVTAGTQRETTQLTRSATNKTALEPNDTDDRTRTIFFFVDDAHLSPRGLSRARDSLKSFVDSEMRQNDQVAIISTSGQIGFLQQLTNHKLVLMTAISRLTSKPSGDGYPGKTKITEFMASRILNQNDRGLFAYLMESTKLEQQMGAGNRHGDHRTSSSYSAGPYLQNRLRQIENQSKANASATLATLRTLMQTTASLTGRKLLFLMSDGFLVNQQDSELVDLMKGVTEAAAQTSTVIYSIDLRESSGGSPVDLSTNGAVDFSSRLAGLEMSERSANREPLNTMSDETGGRVLLNPESITRSVAQVLDETANYYLLAWRPESEDERTGKSRLNVVVRNHPDWRVRIRKKFFQPIKVESQTSAKAADPLSAALASLYPVRQAPLALSAGYVINDSKTNALKLSMQIDPQLFLAQLEGDKHKAEVDVLGAAVDDRGVIITFKQMLTITPDALSGPVIWHELLSAPAGLYQVRVAVRERESGWTGSALQWLEVPEMTKSGSLYMSSLFIANREAGAGGPQPVKVSVDRVFSSGSVLRYQTYLHTDPSLANRSDISEPGAAATGITIRVEVRRNGAPVMSLTPVKAPNTTTNDTIPYWSEISLAQLPPGRYLLKVSAADSKSKSTASQEIDFTIR